MRILMPKELAVLRLLSLALVASIVLPPRAPAQVPPAEPARVEEATPKRSVRIHGTAVAIDPGGTAHADADGSFQIYHQVDGRIDVVVHRGQWEAWCSKEARFIVGMLELGGRGVALPRLPFAPPFDRSFDVKGTWIDDHVVHVVDQKTGEDLDGIEMVNQPERDGYARHPGVLRPELAFAKDLESPLRLTTYGHWFLRAEGHAWVDFDFMDGKKEDDQTLELPLACRLAIDAKEFDRTGPAKIRIEPGNGSVEWLTLDPKVDPWPAAWKDGPIELDALPPGLVHVRALLDFHRKPWFWHTVTLGEAVVTLTPGAPAHAQFVVGPPPAGLHEDGTVDRNGIVTLPDGEERKPFTGDGSIEFRFVKVHPSEGSSRLGPSWSGVFEEKDDGSYDMDRTYVVAIEKGAFHLRPPYGTHLLVSRLVLGGKSIDLERDDARAVNPSLVDTVPSPIEIAVPGKSMDAAADRTTMLHVVDAETKAELSHVEIVSGIDWPRSDCPHPGVVDERNVLVHDGISPLPLPAPTSSHGFRGEGLYWVRADGHAWARFKQETRSGGVRTVALAPAVELDIRLEPNVVAPKSVIRVHGAFHAGEMLKERLAALDRIKPGDLPPGAPSIDELKKQIEESIAETETHPENAEPETDGRPVAEVEPSADGTTRLEALPLGRYAVSLELGEWFSEPAQLGITTVDATKGGRIAVTLAVKPPARAPDPVPLSGTLFIPPEWGRVDATLYVKPESGPNTDYNDWIKLDLKRMKRDEATPGLYAWSAGRVPPGKYELSLSELGFERHVVLGAEGDTAQHIEIAPPADLTVHLVDSVTGEPVAVRQMSWYLQDSSLNSDETVKADDGDASTFQFRAPIGPLTLHVWEQPYDLHAEDVEVHAGRNEFTLKLEKECGVRLILRSGETTIPWDEEAYRISLAQLDGDGSDKGWGGEALAHRVTVSSPGRYRVTFGRFPGFKPVKPREVTIERGQLVDLEVELEVER